MTYRNQDASGLKLHLNRFLAVLALALAAWAVIISVASPAFAQAVALPNDGGTSVNVGGPLAVLLNSVSEIAITILVGLALVASRWLKAKFDVDIENSVRGIAAKHRETLHSALQTGINAALIKFGVSDLSTLSIDVRNKVVADAVRWARDKGAADAVKHFGASADDLAEIALSKLGVTETSITNIYSPALEAIDLGSTGPAN